MKWEYAEDRPTSPSDFNYPMEKQVISVQQGLFPNSIKWLNPNLSDELGKYKNLYRWKCGWKLPAHLGAEGWRYFKKPIYLFHCLCSGPKDSSWLTVGMKIMVKILQQLCIANLTQDQYENGAII